MSSISDLNVLISETQRKLSILKNITSLVQSSKTLSNQSIKFLESEIAKKQLEFENDNKKYNAQLTLFNRDIPFILDDLINNQSKIIEFSKYISTFKTFKRKTGTEAVNITVTSFEESVKKLIPLLRDFNDIKKKGPPYFDEIVDSDYVILSKKIMDLYKEILVDINGKRFAEEFIQPQNLDDFIKNIGEFEIKLKILSQKTQLQDTSSLKELTLSFDKVKYEKKEENLTDRYEDLAKGKLIQNYLNNDSVLLQVFIAKKTPKSPKTIKWGTPDTVQNAIDYLQSLLEINIPSIYFKGTSSVRGIQSEYNEKKGKSPELNLILLFTTAYRKMLSHPSMLKLISLNVDTIISLFLSKLSTKSSIAPENLIMLFVSSFYIDITELSLSLESDVTPLNTLFNYSRRVEIDTKNFKKFTAAINSQDKANINLISKPENTKVLFILQFLSVIEYTIADVKSRTQYIVAFIIRLLDSGIFDDIIVFLGEFLMGGFDNNGEYKYVKSALLESSTESFSPILTYVKVRVDPIPGYTEELYYNKRFKTFVNDKKTSLVIGYNDHNFPYYDMDLYGKYDSELLTTINAQNDILQKYSEDAYNSDFADISNVDVSAIGTDIVKKYTNNYILGPFTKVFHPELNNKAVSERLDEAFSLLSDGKTVLILGYGASGAGKTSSLIYNNQGASDDERNGILISLCNKMALEKGYTKITVSAAEFFTDQKNQDATKPRLRRLGPDEDSYKWLKFSFEKGNFLLDEGEDGYTHKNNFKDRIVECKRKKDAAIVANQQTDKIKCETQFKNKSNLGELLIHLIDSDRYVKATTNNPNSSRSHAIICIKFEGDEKSTTTPKLLIGDFAGVENTFACTDNDVLQRFINIKIPDPKISLELNKNYFYKEYDVEGGENKKHGGAVMPIASCNFDAEDMYAFSKTKFLKKFDQETYDKFFEKFPLIYTTIEGLLLEKYKISLPLIINEIQARIKEGGGNAKIISQKLGEYLEAAGSKWVSDIKSRDFKYDDELLKNLQEKAVSAAIDEDRSKILTEEQKKEAANKVTSIDAMAENLTSFFKFATGIEESKTTKEFMIDFLEAAEKKYLTQWKVNEPILKVLAGFKDEMDSTAAKGFNDDNIVNPSKSDSYKEAYMNYPTLYVKMHKKIWDKINGGVYKKTKYERKTVGSGAIGAESNPVGSWNINHTVFSLAYKNGGVGVTDEYDTPVILIEQQGLPPFEWAQPDITDVLVGNDTVISEWYQRKEGGKPQWYPEGKKLYEEADTKLKEFYKLLEGIFGIFNPAVPSRRQAIDKLQNLQLEFEKFWNNITDDNSKNIMNILYKDADSGKNIYSSIDKGFLFTIINESFQKNIIMKNFVGTMPEVKKMDDINKLIKAFVEYGKDFRAKIGTLQFTYTERNSWIEIITTVNDRLPILLRGFVCKYPLAYSICDVRKIEGQFINYSLGKMREFIKELIDYKLESALNPVPLFEDFCLQNDYCASGECFPSEKSFKGGDINKYTIIEEIKILSGITNPNELNLCIFCVLNLSIKANNPPPIPYIDINKIKKILYKIKNVKSLGGDESVFLKLLDALLIEKDKLVFKIEYEMVSLVDDKTLSLRNTAFYDFKTKIDIYADTYGRMLEGTKFNLMEKESKQTGEIPDELKLYKEKIEASRKNKIWIESEIEKPTERKFEGAVSVSIDELIKVSKQFFASVEVLNPASAIGTLEFVDQVSKYYNILWMCQAERTDPKVRIDPSAEKTGSLLGMKLVEINSKSWKGGVTKKKKCNLKKNIKKKYFNIVK